MVPGNITSKAFILVVFFAASACDRSASPPASESMIAIANRTVEAGCGQCLFGLPGDGCTLAVRFDGTAYYVSGSSIDDHGDAHAADGLCNAIRPAEATGYVRKNRFEADRIVLIPAP